MQSRGLTSAPRRWDQVIKGDRVEVALEGLGIQHGVVDLASTDGDMVWVIVSLGERRLVHKDEGTDLIRSSQIRDKQFPCPCQYRARPVAPEAMQINQIELQEVI